MDRLPPLLKVPWDAGWRLVMYDDGMENAGYIAFTALLALFPFLIFLAALAGFLGELEAAEIFVLNLFELVPRDVAETLRPAVDEVLNTRAGGLLTVGILVTIWVASTAIEALRTGLNRAYGVGEWRPIWWRRLQAIAFVVVAALALFLISLTVLLGPIIWAVLGWVAYLQLSQSTWVLLLRTVIAVVVLFGAVLILHYYLPNTRERARDLLPGVLATVVLWVISAYVFSWYLGTLADYSLTYGSLGGVIITLVFFYLAAFLFLYGAELNAAYLRYRQGKRQDEPVAPAPDG
jgi:membrane protein